MTGSLAKFAGEIISGSSDYNTYNQNNGGKDFFGNTVSDSVSPHIGAYNGNELLGEVVEVPIPYQYTLLLLLIVFYSVHKIAKNHSKWNILFIVFIDNKLFKLSWHFFKLSWHYLSAC